VDGRVEWFFIKGTSKNSLKPNWLRWKVAKNAHLLRVNGAFSPLSALPDSPRLNFRGALNSKITACNKGLSGNGEVVTLNINQ